MPSIQSIYAEVELSTSRDLPNEVEQAIESRFGKGADKRLALPQTIHKGNERALESVVYARDAYDEVFLVFPDGPRKLKAHVQRKSRYSSLSEVKRAAEEMAERLAGFAKHHRCRAKPVKVRIYVAERLLLTGTKHSWWHRVRQGLRNDAGSVLALPVAAVLLSFPLGSGLERALENGLIALLALVLRGLIAATLQKSEFKQV